MAAHQQQVGAASASAASAVGPSPAATGAPAGVSPANLAQMQQMRQALFGPANAKEAAAASTAAAAAVAAATAAAASTAPHAAGVSTAAAAASSSASAAAAFYLSANSATSNLLSSLAKLPGGAATNATAGANANGTTAATTTGGQQQQSLSSLLSGLRSAGFPPKLARSRAASKAPDKAPLQAHSAPGGKAACLAGCTTYPRCSCRLKSSLKDKLKKKFDLRSFMTSTAALAAPNALQVHMAATSSSKDAKESELLSSIRMLADLLEDGKLCVAETVGGGAVERLNACLQLPALQNATLESLGVLLQCWLKLDRATAHHAHSGAAAGAGAAAAGAKPTGAAAVAAAKLAACKKQPSSGAIVPGKKASKKADIAMATLAPLPGVTCSCCAPLTTGGLCGTCNVCLSGTQIRFETWVQLHAPGPVPPATTKDDLLLDDAAALTTATPSPPPSPGIGAILLTSALRLLRQSSTRKLACYLVSHFSSIPSAALALIHLDGAITTLLDVYASLSDTKDSQLLVHLSAIIAGLCSKPTKATIGRLLPVVPALLARFRQCSNTLVVAYICTALGRLCDGQPAVAQEIMKFNITSYLLFLYYSAVERVKKREKPRKDEKDLVAFEDLYGLLGLLVFHDQADVSVLLCAPRVRQATPFGWIMKTAPAQMRADFTGRKQTDEEVAATTTARAKTPLATEKRRATPTDGDDADTEEDDPPDPQLEPPEADVDADTETVPESDPTDVDTEVNSRASTPPPTAAAASSATASPSSSTVVTTSSAVATTTSSSSSKPGKTMDLVDIIGQILDLLPSSVPLHADDDHWYYFQRSCWQVSMILRSGSAPCARIQRLLDGGVVQKLLSLMAARVGDMPAASLCEAGQALSYTLLQATSLQMATLIFSGLIPTLLAVLANPRCSVRCSLAIVDGIAAILAMGVKDRAVAVKRVRERATLRRPLGALLKPSSSLAVTTSAASLASALSGVELSSSDDGSDSGICTPGSTESDEDDDDYTSTKLYGAYEQDEADLAEAERRHQNKVQRRKNSSKKQCTDQNRLAAGATSFALESMPPPTAAASAPSLSLQVDIDAQAAPSSSPAATPSSAASSSGCPPHSAKSKRKALGDFDDASKQSAPRGSAAASRCATPLSRTGSTTPSQFVSIASPSASVPTTLDEEATTEIQLAHMATGESLLGAAAPSAAAAASSFEFTSPRPAAGVATSARKPRRRAVIVLRAAQEVLPPTPFVTTLTDTPPSAIVATPAGYDAATAAMIAQVAAEVALMEAEGEFGDSVMPPSEAIAAAGSAIASAAAAITASSLGVAAAAAPPVAPPSYWFSYPNYNGYAGLLLAHNAYALLVRLRTHYATRNSKDEKLLRTALDNVVSFLGEGLLRAPSVFDPDTAAAAVRAVVAETEAPVTTASLPALAMDLTEAWSLKSTGLPPKLFFTQRVLSHRTRLRALIAARLAREEATRATTFRRRQIREMLAWAALTQGSKPLVVRAAEEKRPRAPSQQLKHDSEAETEDEDDTHAPAPAHTDAPPVILDAAAQAAEDERLREVRRKKLKNKKLAKAKKKVHEREEREKLAAATLEVQLKFAAAELALAQADAALEAMAKEESLVLAELRSAQAAAQEEAALNADAAAAAALVDTGADSTSAPSASAAAAAPASAEPAAKVRVAPPVIARCRNACGTCVPSGAQVISGFEEYVEMLCTENCLITYHHALPSKDYSCFAQVCAQPLAQDEPEGHRTVEQQRALFGDSQLVRIQMDPNQQGEVKCALEAVSLPPTPASGPVAGPCVRKLVRNSPCFTPDCPGRISSLVVKSGRGNQMKVLRVLVQFREVTLRRERERAAESKKVKKAFEAERLAKEEAERAAELEARLAARTIELREAEEAREKAEALQRERDSALAAAREGQRERDQAERKARVEEREREREKEAVAKEREREYKTQLAALQHAKEAALLQGSASRESPNFNTPRKELPSSFTSVNGSPAPPARPSLLGGHERLQKPFASNAPAVNLLPMSLVPRPPSATTGVSLTSRASGVPPSGGMSFAKALHPTPTAAFAPIVNIGTSSNALLGMAASPVLASPSSAATAGVGSSLAPTTNWASLMGGGSAANSSAAAAAAAATAASSAAAAAALASKLSRKQKKDRASKPSGLSPSSSSSALAGFYDHMSILRTDMVLGGLVRCRATVPTRFLYVQHCPSLPELQRECSPFGFHSLTSCYNPTAVLIEFGEASQAAACYDALNGVYFARYADDPLMVLLDGQTEALPILMPPLLPYAASLAYQNQQSLIQLSKRERAKMKRQEAIAASKEERIRRRIEKASQYRGGGGGSDRAMLGLDDGADSPYLDTDDSPYQLSSLPLHDDEAFPMLGETATGQGRKSHDSGTASHASECGDGDEDSPTMQAHAFLPTPLFSEFDHAHDDADLPDHDEEPMPERSLMRRSVDEGHGASASARDRDDTFLFSIFSQQRAESAEEQTTKTFGVEARQDEAADPVLAPAYAFASPHRPNLSLLSSAFLSSASPTSAVTGHAQQPADAFSASESWSLFAPPAQAAVDGGDTASWGWRQESTPAPDSRSQWPSATDAHTPFTSLLSTSRALVSSGDSPALSPSDAADLVDAPVADDEFDIGGGLDADDAYAGWELGDDDPQDEPPTLRPNGAGDMMLTSWSLGPSLQDSILPSNTRSSITSLLQQTFASNSNSPPHQTTGSSSSTQPAAADSNSSSSSAGFSPGTNNGGGNTVNINLSLSLNVHVTNFHVTNVAASPQSSSGQRTAQGDFDTTASPATADPWHTSTPRKEPLLQVMTASQQQSSATLSSSVWNTSSFSQVAGATTTMHTPARQQATTTATPPAAAAAAVVAPSPTGVSWARSASKGNAAPSPAAPLDESASWELVGKRVR